MLKPVPCLPWVSFTKRPAVLPKRRGHARDHPARGIAVGQVEVVVRPFSEPEGPLGHDEPQPAVADAPAGPGEFGMGERREPIFFQQIKMNRILSCLPQTASMADESTRVPSSFARYFARAHGRVARRFDPPGFTGHGPCASPATGLLCASSVRQGNSPAVRPETGGSSATEHNPIHGRNTTRLHAYFF